MARVQISCSQARAGMYVLKFGGSWFRHPFWRAHFLLTSEEDVQRVRTSGVPYIIIDDQRGVAAEPAIPAAAPQAAPRPANVRRPALSSVSAVNEPAERPRSQRDRDRAARLVQQAKNRMKGVFEAARLGKAVRRADVELVVDDIVASIEHNAQALIGVIRLKSKDEYTYFHSVAVCTLMVNLARHHGLDEATTRDFGLAGLLHDIGKMGIPDDILNKPGKLSDGEFAIVRDHPNFGHSLLSATPDMSPTALDVCLHHHEKIDGTGYPFAMPGEAISLAARAGAICDVYDALTSDRVYKEGWAPAEAISAMWNWEGHFDQALLFEFMQSISVFPRGLLVRLRSNRLALTLENRRRASRPRVCAFYSTRDREFLDPEIVVIRDDLSGDQILAAEEPALWGFTEWDALALAIESGQDPRFVRQRTMTAQAANG